MQCKTEGAMRVPMPWASKPAPTWMVFMTASKSLYGRLDLDPIQRLAIKGFWDNHTGIPSGGSFRRSWQGRSHGTLRFALHFFTTQTIPFELCAGFFSVFFRQLLATTCWYFELEIIFGWVRKFPEVNLVYFNVEMQDNINMRKDNFFGLQPGFWPEGRLWDFFGLKEAEGLLKAKKSQKRPSGQKTWLQHKQKHFWGFRPTFQCSHKSFSSLFLTFLHANEKSNLKKRSFLTPSQNKFMIS